MAMKCSDCPAMVDEKMLGAKALAKGSSVREPGEALCSGCSSARIILVRKVAKIPDTIDQIKAKRMVRA